MYAQNGIGFSRTITTYRENPISCRQQQTTEEMVKLRKKIVIGRQTTKNHRGKPTTSRQICEKFCYYTFHQVFTTKACVGQK